MKSFQFLCKRRKDTLIANFTLTAEFTNTVFFRK